MGWRFRKSFKVFPGTRINLSRHGLSATIGISPISLNVGGAGAHLNLNIPGTGISYRQKLTGVGVATPGSTDQPSEVGQPTSLQIPLKADEEKARNQKLEYI